ncbi:MAG: SapC family protein [Pirellulaceae bacterium]
MAQMLFYENVAPVSKERHKDLSIERVDFGFAANVNSVPLTAVEMPLAAREYTIVFVGNEETVSPLVILGVDGSQNQYLDENLAWKADYIPAFVRRYPFVFSQNEDAKRFTLCVDESWSGCNREGRGQALFAEDGAQTPYLQDMLKFLGNYQEQAVRTQAYCKKLKELDLLEPMQAEIVLPGGEKRAIRGFLGATRKKIKALDAEKLAELVKTDELELSYLQMASLNNLNSIVNRTRPKKATEVEESEPVEDE